MSEPVLYRAPHHDCTSSRQTVPADWIGDATQSRRTQGFSQALWRLASDTLFASSMAATRAPTIDDDQHQKGTIGHW